jgi:hypothetical protein
MNSSIFLFISRARTLGMFAQCHCLQMDQFFCENVVYFIIFVPSILFESYLNVLKFFSFFTARAGRSYVVSFLFLPLLGAVGIA